jgi:hypothetical protein
MEPLGWPPTFFSIPSKTAEGVPLKPYQPARLFPSGME